MSSCSVVEITWYFPIPSFPSRLKNTTFSPLRSLKHDLSFASENSFKPSSTGSGGSSATSSFTGSGSSSACFGDSFGDDFGEDWQVDDKKDITKAIAVTCSAGHMTIFLSRDGEASDSIGWTASGISDISSSGWLTLGIKEDGTVTGTGEDYSYLNGDLSRWTDIVQVLAGDVSAAGLKSDGTVVVAGGIEMDGEKFPIFSESQEWTDIKLLRSDGEKVLIGIKNDGTVAAAKRDEDAGDYYFDYDLDACLKEIGTWTDIVDVSVAYDHIVGLKSDGTVVAVGNNDDQQCELY